MTKANKATPSNGAEFVPFVFGATEVAALDVWRGATEAEGDAALSFYRVAIKRHGVALSYLAPLAKGSRRTNEGQAAFDYARLIFATKAVGLSAAQKLLDGNVKGDALIVPDVGSRAGKTYEKRPLVQSLLGGKEWGVFVKRLHELEAIDARADLVAAAIAAGEEVPEEVEAPKRGKKGEAASDAKYTLDRVTAVINRLSREAEKMDGTIDLVTAGKMSTLLFDCLVAGGLAKRK